VGASDAFVGKSEAYIVQFLQNHNSAHRAVTA
jgi:hypothetical protein